MFRVIQKVPKPLKPLLTPTLFSYFFSQKDDILVTRVTDIGWSPYFPLIKGLVTEIGGILSHGT